jgi:hypothetical protein
LSIEDAISPELEVAFVQVSAFGPGVVTVALRPNTKAKPNPVAGTKIGPTGVCGFEFKPNCSLLAAVGAAVTFVM